MKADKELKNTNKGKDLAVGSPRMARVNTNLNSPKAKIPPTQKNLHSPRTGAHINSKIAHLKTQNGQRTSDLNTPKQEHDNYQANIGQLEQTTSTSISTQNQIPKQESTKNHPRIGSPRNYFYAKPYEKKISKEKPATANCKTCSMLKIKQEELLKRIEDLETQHLLQSQNKQRQICELNEQKEGLEKKLNKFDSLVSENRKLIKEKVNKFNTEGQEFQKLTKRINELEEQVEILERQRAAQNKLEEEMEVHSPSSPTNQPRNQNLRLSNLVEVSSESISNDISMSDLVEKSEVNKASEKGLNRHQVNDSDIYRMLESQIENSEHHNGQNQKENIKGQGSEDMDESEKQYAQKIKALEIKIIEKQTQMKNLKEEVSWSQDEKNRLEQQLKEYSCQIDRLKRENNALRGRISELEERKFNSGNTSRATVPSQFDVSTRADRKSILMERCMKRRLNNKNCLQMLDRIKNISDQQCGIIEQMRSSSRLVHSELEQLAKS